MKVPPKRKGNSAPTNRPALHLHPSMKVPPKRKGNALLDTRYLLCRLALNESPSEKEAFLSTSYKCLNESPSEKEGKCYPKIARNHAAETGASREPRGGYTQNYTLQPHLPPHNSLAREETMRATRHVPVTYQVLAHTKTPAGCFLSDPARVLTYERGWRGSGKPD